MSFAAPVSKNGFFYNGDLYVEVGALHRHKRASIPEITSILRPDLKKLKSATATPNKDQVGHWYEAQLIHYGLPPSKDKSRAKMRLLEALNQSTLNVPPEIANLEDSLRKEYNATERKAKAQYKAEQGANVSSVKNENKRSHPDSAANINVNINFHGPGVASASTSQPEASISAKKVKTAPSKPSAKKKANEDNDGSSKPANSAAKTNGSRAAPKNALTPQLKTEGKSSGQQAKSGANAKPTTAQSSNTKQPAKQEIVKREPAVKKEASTKKIPIPAVKKEASIKKEHPVKKEATAKKEPAVKKEASAKKNTTTVKGEPKSTNEPATKKNTPAKQEQPSNNRPPVGPSLGLINGYYDISCSSITDPIDGLSFILTLDGPMLWGAYDLGPYTGVFYLQDRPYRAASHIHLPLRWRGIDKGDGHADSGNGYIAFLGDGRISGLINIYGNEEFDGTRRASAGPTTLRSAASMREEWEGYDVRSGDDGDGDNQDYGDADDGVGEQMEDVVYDDDVEDTW